MNFAVDTIVDPPASDAQNARSAKAFIGPINTTWNKNTTNIIDCSKLLCEAHAELPRDEFEAMVESKLDFEASVARKLLRIGSNKMLCAPGHKLPPNWTILYELSKLPKDVLKAALADGSIHPRMSRADAAALRPVKQTADKPTTTSSVVTTNSGRLDDIWQAASQEERRAFLDRLGHEGFCAAASPVLLADLRDRVVDVTIATASRSTKFATRATNWLNTALYCAGQPDPSEENTRRMAAVLRSILKMAQAEGIAHSDIVIAEGKPKGKQDFAHSARKRSRS